MDDKGNIGHKFAGKEKTKNSPDVLSRPTSVNTRGISIVR